MLFDWLAAYESSRHSRQHAVAASGQAIDGCAGDAIGKRQKALGACDYSAVFTMLTSPVAALGVTVTSKFKLVPCFALTAAVEPLICRLGWSR